ncbi:MAG: glycosyltransferase family 4 protein [Patescibacteria group bacterium]
MMKDRVCCLIVGVLPGSLTNFRGSLIKAIIEKGVKVCTAANGRDASIETKVLEMGAEYYPIHIKRAGVNPLADLVTILDLINLMRRIKPDIVLTYTIKPIIYGGLAARLCGVKNIFSMIEGLGYIFMPYQSLSHVLSSTVARWLYRIGLLSSKRVFLLNPDDLNQFVRERYISGEKAILLNGIGVDLQYYAREELPKLSCIRFLMVSRLLKDKGVREYVEAARMVRTSYQNVEFVLAGDLDDNPNSIKQDELDSWQEGGIINYAGYISDVRPLLRDCHVYVLPSFYREGIPRTVLEAMSVGRAIITTDAPGCRETIKKALAEVLPETEEVRNLRVGLNGIMVPVKNVESLATAMLFFLKHTDQIAIMGNESRCYVEERYNIREVNAVILHEMGIKNYNNV